MEKENFLYLHIGTPKTGTTSLQGYLAANCKGLLEQGFYYRTDEKISSLYGPLDMEIPQNTNGHWILAALDEVSQKLIHRDFLGVANLDAKAVEMLADVDFEEHSATFRRNIADLKTRLEKQNVILSNELLWNIPQIYLKQLYKRLQGRVKVVVYLRRQDFLLESSYNHAIRQSPMRVAFDEFMGLFGTLPYLRRTVRYRETLDEISGITGKENLIVRIYGSKDKDGNPFDIKKDFADVIGIDLKKTVTHNNKNTRISGQSIEYLRAFYSMIGELPKECRPSPEREKRINDILCQISKRSGPDLYFTPEGRREFLQAYEDENAYIADTYLDGAALSDEGIPADAEATVHPLSGEELDRLYFMTALILS